MIQKTCLPDGTTLIQRDVDWGADLAWITTQELGLTGPSPGRPDLIVAAARQVLLGQQGTGRTVYINPEFTVIAPFRWSSSEFIRHARRAQREYLQHFKSILFSSRRMKNELTRVDPITRQLTFTGLLLIDGEHIHPSRWPDTQNPQVRPLDAITKRLTIRRLRRIRHR